MTIYKRCEINTSGFKSWMSLRNANTTHRTTKKKGEFFLIKISKRSDWNQSVNNRILMQTCVNQEIEEMEYFLCSPAILRHSQLYPYQLHLQWINPSNEEFTILQETIKTSRAPFNINREKTIFILNN